MRGMETGYRMCQAEDGARGLGFDTGIHRFSISVGLKCRYFANTLPRHGSSIVAAVQWPPNRYFTLRS